MSVRGYLQSLVAPLAASFFLLSCANQIPPQGGPVDTVPPKIIATYPLSYTTHFADDKLDLEFDKYVDHRSAEESIFISPYVGDLQFDWSGKEVEVTFSEKLRPNKTYVVNIGTDVVDLNNHNRMAQAYTLAFSTGDDIDHGAIRGRVFPAKPEDHPEGVMIFAYQLAGLNPDTLDPRTLKPDYITQTGKNGEFFLQHLAFGAYRVFAIRDEFRNLLYDPEADDFGVPSHPLVLSPTDTLQDDITMKLAKEDTTAPRLVKADPRDVHHILVEFSESIDTNATAPLGIAIIDTLTRQSLKAIAIYPNLPKLSSWTVVTERQDSTKSYQLTVTDAHDLVGLSMSSVARSLTFAGAVAVDTSAPRIVSISVPDSARGVPLKPDLQIRFSDAVRRSSFDNALELKDSTGKVVAADLFWLDDAVLKVKTKNPLQSKCWHKLSITLYNATDWSGKRFRDSVKVVKFETLDAEALSSIEGIVVDMNLTDLTGTVFVEADAVDVKEAKPITVIASRDGSFAISEIAEGRYVLHAFRDRNENGTFDVGRPFPFVASERFSFLPDTLKLRARWPLEGVRIDLK